MGQDQEWPQPHFCHGAGGCERILSNSLEDPFQFIGKILDCSRPPAVAWRAGRLPTGLEKVVEGRPNRRYDQVV